jgi:hypothetical protein
VPSKRLASQACAYRRIALGNGISKVLYRLETQKRRLIKVTAFRLGIRKKWVNNRRIREKGSDQGE